MGAEFKTLVDVLKYAAKQYNKPDAYCFKVKGEWKLYSHSDADALSDKLAWALIASGLKAGDRVAIISPNRPEWVIVDFAIQKAGLISIPVYPTITEDDYAYIFNHSEVQLIFAAEEELAQKAKNILGRVPSVKEIYTFNHIPGFKHWEELLNTGNESEKPEMERRLAAINTHDLFTIIYTSGTTGTPKGVKLSHFNLINNVTDSLPAVPVDSRHKALSFLPMCHIYERMLVYLYTRCGVSVWFAESMDTIGENLKEVQPHIFTTVPRLLEKVYDKIVAKGHDLSGIKKALFFWALNLGLKYEPFKPMGFWYDLQLSLANKIIFNKWREALGGNIICAVVGSAALQPRLARVFWAAQIKVLEGYGLTETSPVVAVNRVDDTRVGTVGKLIENVEVKIAADGEILTRGNNIMLGYYQNQVLTDEVLNDGWFHTGDIGEIVEGKYLKITDRKKEMFKTGGGKYIAPQYIENKLKESLVIEQAMVVGEGEKFPAALIVPAIANLKEWCKLKGIAWEGSDVDMLRKPLIIDKYQKELDRVNESLAQYERIKKFAVVEEPWTISGGELTPTLKLKRKAIMAKLQAKVKELYAQA